MKERISYFTLRGSVISGKGRGRIFVSLSWFKEYVKETLNFEPFPGTLNLMLSSEDSRKLAEIFKKFNGIRIPSKSGYLPGKLYRALIESRVEGAIVRPKVFGYPENMIEVIAPICLREFLNLKDGDEIEVKIFVE